MLNVLLNFKSMEDFDPVSVVQQIAPLKELYDARSRLRDLLAKLDGNDDLEAILAEIIASTEEQTKLREELKAALTPPPAADGAAPAG
jgi:type VI secretion system protein ImpB